MPRLWAYLCLTRHTSHRSSGHTSGWGSGPTSKPSFEPRAQSWVVTVEYPEDIDAVVYDLDGTLLRLAVDWERVAADVGAVYGEARVPTEGDGVWELLERAEENGIEREVEEAIGVHEREGARESTRLHPADDLVELGLPAGVCSLNCEAACRIGLETHGLTEHIDAVVGRDTVGTHKPDPEPLLAAVDALDVDPGATLFVGDSESDELTATRAGTAFSYVGDGPTNLGR
jgi:phosphoglycolate phosphatase-like HAD superfamily hydrolase